MAGFVVDYTITIGNLVEIGSIVGGGLAVFLTLKNNVANLKDDVLAMQDEIKKLTTVMINQADMRGDIKSLVSRVDTIEQDIRELRHGQGFIRGPAGIDREYP